MRSAALILTSVALVTSNPSFANSPPAKALSLLTVLEEGAKADPRLASQRYLEQASDENIRMKKSKYFPEINVAAVASTGDPGSFSMLDVDTNLSSSQRVGYGGALVLKQNIWDFGRTSNAVHSAELEKELSKKEEVFTSTEVGRDLLRTYLDCAFLKTHLENSRFIVEQAKLLDAEISRFVHSGQKSIIEKYLVDTEEKAAETRVAEFSERLRTTEERLSILLSKTDGERVSCEGLPQVKRDVEWMQTSISGNPIMDIQELRSQIAQSKIDEAKSENRPKIFGMALAGSFDNDHLKDKNHYAAGIGVSLPLFSGFLIDSQINKQESELLAQRSSVEGTRQAVAAANSTFDEKIRSLRVRAEFLDQERAHAKKVFDLAHQRYEDMQGSMNDLRESIKNMNRLVLESDQTLRDLLLAEGEKSLFNGFNMGPRK